MSSSINTQSVRVFIPFIQAGVTTAFITQLFADKLLGKVVAISLHDKKIALKTGLKSANHSYAFITFVPSNTSVGINLRRNLEYNHTTHVMYVLDGFTYGFDVKPHLTIEDRLERGFHIIPSKSIPEYNPTSVPEVIVSAEPTPAVDVEVESEPEWMNYEFTENFNFHHIPPVEAPFEKICKELMRIPSYFDQASERKSLLTDYLATEREIAVKQEKYQEWCMWTSHTFA